MGLIGLFIIASSSSQGWAHSRSMAVRCSACMQQQEIHNRNQKFCLYAEEETPAEGVRKKMLKVLRRMFSDQVDANLCETYENRNEDVAQPTAEKTLYVYNFLTPNVLSLQCINPDKDIKERLYEGIIWKDIWINIIDDEDTKSMEMKFD
jgi:hypothetical protein